MDWNVKEHIHLLAFLHGKQLRKAIDSLRTWDKDSCEKSMEIEICRPQSAMLSSKLDLTEFPGWTQPLPA